MNKRNGMSLHDELALAKDAAAEWREMAAAYNTENGKLNVMLQVMSSNLQDTRAEIGRLKAIIAVLEEGK